MRKIMLSIGIVLLLSFSTVQSIGIIYSNHSFKIDFLNEHIQTTIIINPYEEINFDTFHHYKANLHTHTLNSDGSSSPAEVIYFYHDIGDYDILSITDHNKNTWPWTKYIPEDPVSSSKSSAFYPDLEMLAISGNEMSLNHHRNSLLNGYSGGGLFLHFSFWIVEKKQGLSFFNHPGRYDYPVEWYQRYFDKFDSLVGMEVYNQGDRYDQDRLLWDQINKQRNPDDLIWGLSNDDIHHLKRDAFRNYQYFFMNDLTVSAFRSSLEQGSFYFCYEPNGSDITRLTYGQAMTPILTEVKIIGDMIQLTGESYDMINWIDENSQIIDTGNVIDVSSFESNFVRAVLVNEYGRTYTQPFGLLPN